MMDSSSKSSTSSNSSLSTRAIKQIVERLKFERFSYTTRQTYYRVWKLFNKFFVRLERKPNNWEDRLVLFTGFLIDNELKSTSVRSYLSAIRAVLTENDIVINENRFLLNSMTRAIRLKNDKLITKLPIRKELLLLILKEIKSYYEKEDRNQPYLDALYQAMFTASYYGLLRVGEVAQGPHVIQARNVHIGANKNKMLFILTSSKTHSQGNKPQMVKTAQKPYKSETVKKAGRILASHMNPFEILWIYIQKRPPMKNLCEQFFVFSDNRPVKPEHLRAMLKITLNQLNIPHEYYCLHSTRVGRASDLLDYGLSVETIKKIGRWRSNAVFTYLRS